MAIRMWTHLSTTDFLGIDREKYLVLLPFGSTEQHGPQLPVGTDCFLVEEVMRRLEPHVADLDVLRLPTLWCTKSNEHSAFAGSLYLQAETIMAMVHDLAGAVSRSGFQKLVLLNWHGGNTDLLSAMAPDIRQRHHLTVFIIDIVRLFMGPTCDQSGDVAQFDIHAGCYETGMMLAAHADLVKPGPYEGIGSDLERGPLARSFGGYKYLIPEGGPVRVGWETTDLTTDGVIGNPARANPEQGDRDLHDMVARVKEMLHEIARFQYRS